jgi:hypothetical protein
MENGRGPRRPIDVTPPLTATMMDILFKGAEADRIDDWLYLPETHYAFMLLVVISAGAKPYSLGALILGLINKHAV